MCQEPLDPINGHVNCTSNIDSLHCTLTCEDGYAFAVQPRDYFCTYDSDGSVLSPDSTIDPFPDCSCKFILFHIYISFIAIHRFFQLNHFLNAFLKFPTSEDVFLWV